MARLKLAIKAAVTEEPGQLTGIEYQVEVARQRFAGTAGNVVPSRKPPQRANAASSQSRNAWAGAR
jgi:hypothetical protein